MLCCMKTCVVYVSMGVPEAQTVKNPPADAGDPGMIPGSGRCPGGGNGNPTQSSCLEESMDRAAWQVIPSIGSQKELDTPAGLNNCKLF